MSDPPPQELTYGGHREIDASDPLSDIGRAGAPGYDLAKIVAYTEGTTPKTRDSILTAIAERA